MNEHAAVNELLSEYVANILSASDRLRVECHLSECTQCQADLKLWQAISCEARSISQHVVVPSGLTERILVQIDAYEQSHLLFRGRVSAVIGAILFCTGIAMLFFGPSNSTMVGLCLCMLALGIWQIVTGWQAIQDSRFPHNARKTDKETKGIIQDVRANVEEATRALVGCLPLCGEDVTRGHYTIQRLASEPIIIITYWGPTDLGKVAEGISAKIDAFIKPDETKVYCIHDLRGAILDFRRVIWALSVERQNRPGAGGDPRLRTLVIGRGIAAHIAFKASERFQHSSLRIPVFSTMEEALAHAHEKTKKAMTSS